MDYHLNKNLNVRYRLIFAMCEVRSFESDTTLKKICKCLLKLINLIVKLEGLC